MTDVYYNTKISEELKFSICGLCAVALSQAFFEEFNQKFKRTAIHIIIAHFDVSEKIKATIIELADGDGEDKMEPYFLMLQNSTSDIKISNVDLLHELFFLFINQGEYSSRTRYFLRHLAYGLHLTVDDLQTIENRFIEILDEKTSTSNVTDPESIRRDKKRKIKRGLLIGAAAIGGGVLIGVTGGLAAPFIATGIGAVGASIAGGVGVAVTGASVALGSTAGVAVVGSLFGGAGAGLTGYKMKRRVGQLTEFRIEPFSRNKSFTLTIAISGLLNQGTADFYIPWCTLHNSLEQYYLVWESRYLAEMTHAVEYMLSFVKSAALTETLKLTAFATLLSAIIWPSALLTVSSAIDNPWSVCCTRAELAGRTLADTLLSADYGRRPVTLIGYSLGARAVFYCLLELASRTANEVEDIIEEVYLIGAPITASCDTWNKIERVVSCRIVNAYCSTDWILKFLYRTSNVTYHIAGLQPVNWSNKRMCNIDISSIVSGHSDYSQKMPEILEFLSINTRSFSLPLSTESEAVAKPVASDSGNKQSNTDNKSESALVEKSESEAVAKPVASDSGNNQSNTDNKSESALVEKSPSIVNPVDDNNNNTNSSNTN